MKKSWRNNVEFYLIGLLLLMVIAFSIAMPNIFWSVSNFQSIASQMPVLGILALAMAMTMLCGGINLSIIATANACSLVMAWVATSYPPGGATALATLLAGGGAAMIIGLCNGILIAGIRVSPILATLGMMTLLKGINILITGGSAIANYPQWVLWLNHAQWFGIPLPMWLFAVVAAGLWVLLEKSPLGRAIMLIGSNERATHYSGINTRRVLMWVYVISALLCAVAAFLMMSKLNSAKASYGESYLLVSILAAVLGGVNPDGGSGRIVGMVLALFLLQIIESGFNILGISPYLTMALWGVLLLCFIQARGMLGLERAGYMTRPRGRRRDRQLFATPLPRHAASPWRQLRAQRQRRDQIIAMILPAEWNGLGLPQRVQPLGQGGALIGELPGIGFIRAVEHQRRKHLKAGIEQHTVLNGEQDVVDGAIDPAR
ncbi:hypothetical protein JRT4AKPX_JRT4AKP_05077 [Klebsiella pneumoniae]|nr:hypothetical protein JRT4AKPX_JRT4AKP_05077 [Klebsiella pneumoniae]